MFAGSRCERLSACDDDDSSKVFFSIADDTFCNSDDEFGRCSVKCNEAGSLSVSESDDAFVGISIVVSSNGFSIQQSSSSVSFSSSLGGLNN